MERWNPNLYLNEGQAKEFTSEYLKKLVDTGRRIQAHELPVVYSLSHLANLSRTRYSDLHSIVARKNVHQKDYPYKNFSIRKRRGGRRWISIPAPALMAVQAWINKEVLKNVRPHNAAMAFVHGLRSPLKKHAERHCGADWILKLDISNFFSNISERQVYDVFQKLDYPALLSFEMARLCTRVTPARKGRRWKTEWKDYEVEDYSSHYIGSLPQGAPTSPALSNLVCIEMDYQLESLARKNSATYSRYADDLCFSFGRANRECLFKFKKEVVSILWSRSFTENKKKTRIVPPGARKIVTGLIINESQPTVPKELRDRIRMHLHFAKNRSIPEHCIEKGFRSVIGFRNHLNGLIQYVKAIDPKKGDKFLKKFERLPWLDFEI